MPSRGRKIWEASALATETRRDPPKRRVLPQKLRLATHKPLLIWRFLALNGAFSAGLGFTKSIQERSYEFQTGAHVHSRRITIRQYTNIKPVAQITHITYSVSHVSNTANAPTPILHESIGIIDQTVPFTQRASARRGELGTPQLRASANWTSASLAEPASTKPERCSMGSASAAGSPRRSWQINSFARSRIWSSSRRTGRRPADKADLPRFCPVSATTGVTRFASTAIFSDRTCHG
jgi:hypothetical protein